VPKKIPEEEFEQIESILRGFSNPVSINEIRDQLSQIPFRTLQRRLAWLVNEKRIEIAGERKNRRYRISAVSHSRKENLEKTQIPISDEGREILALVIRPINTRTPIGYQNSFLEEYEPNSSAYLSDEVRNQLRNMGHIGSSELPAGTYIRQLLDRLLIDISWNSSRLEGNTYSLLETERLIQMGAHAEGKEAKETQMILNHKSAIEMLAERAEEIGFNRYTVCNLHALLSDTLLSDPGACGRIRSRPVAISGTVFYPLEIPQAIEHNFQMILDKAGTINDPFEQALFIMVHIPYLQPFEDVNKRVSRLAANIPLIKANLCPLSFVDVPQPDYINAVIGVYELNRVEYLRDVFVWAYHRSCARYSAIQQSLGQPDPVRVMYRMNIKYAVSHIIKNTIKKSIAPKWIADYVDLEIPEPDRAKVFEIIETELSCLHEGSIARYGIKPAEYLHWRSLWKQV
jgi:hypothetical protein